MNTLACYTRKCLAILCLVAATSGLLSQAISSEEIGVMKDDVREVSASEAAQILKEDPTIRVLDVRTGFEYKRGHLQGAVNINYYGLGFKKKLATLDKNTRWLVHCKTGVRSGKTIPLMKEAGFVNIIHMSKGIDAWREVGLPVVK